MTKHIRKQRPFIITQNAFTKANFSDIFQKDDIVGLRIHQMSDIYPGIIEKVIPGYNNTFAYNVRVLTDTVTSIKKNQIILRPIYDLYHISKKTIKKLRRHGLTNIICSIDGRPTIKLSKEEKKNKKKEIACNLDSSKDKNYYYNRTCVKREDKVEKKEVIEFDLTY